MKKILFYIPFIKVGGLEKVALDYLNGLQKNGYKVDLLIDFDLGIEGNTLQHAIPKGINYHFAKTKKVSQWIYKFRTLGKKYRVFNILLFSSILLSDLYYFHFKLKRSFENSKYDFTISFYQFSPSYITRLKSAKHLIWLHGSVPHFFGRFSEFLSGIYIKKLSKYDNVITIAQEMRVQLETLFPEFPKEKIKMIYNPFNFQEIEEKSIQNHLLSGQERELISKNFICTVARIDENQKDISTLILAYEKLFQLNMIEDKLYIIGEGHSKENLEKMVTEKNLQQQILFLGKKTNPFIWMKSARIFILSSKFEGFGLVLVEAMSLGTYTISSNCSTGPKEILEEGKSGDLFHVGDHGHLAYLINKALNDDELRNEKIQRAKVRIQEFDQELAFSELVNLLTNSNSPRNN